MGGEDVAEDFGDEYLRGGDWLNLDIEGGMKQGNSDFTVVGDGKGELERESGPKDHSSWVQIKF